MVIKFLFDYKEIVKHGVLMFPRFPAPGFVDPFKKVEAKPQKESDPAKALQRVIASTPFAGDLMRCDREIVTRSLAAFERAYPDSPTRRLRAQHVNETLAVIRGRFHAVPPSAAFHREAMRVFSKCTWLPDLIAFLKRLPLHYPLAVKPHTIFPQVINLPHIIDGDRQGGFHFCPPGHPRRAELEDIRINPRTKVMTARVDGVTKSFFPDFIRTEDQVTKVLVTGRVIAKEGNCTLFTSHTDPSFPFETRTNREGADLMSSAFPLIHYSRLQQGATIDIATGLSISPDEIQRRRDAHRGGATRLFGYYDDPSQAPREIYEISPLLTELPTGARGHYLDVATGFLPDPPFSPTLVNSHAPIGFHPRPPTGPAAPPATGSAAPVLLFNVVAPPGPTGMKIEVLDEDDE